MSNTLNSTRIDDRDSTIVYRPRSGWTRIGSMVTTKTTQATALVPFYGTQICAYGAIQNLKRAKGPFFSCSVDGQPVQSNPEPPTNSNECLCNTTVPLAMHNLMITNLANDTLLYLDCFFVSQPPRVANLPGVISSTSTSISWSLSTSTTKDPLPKPTYEQSSQSYSRTTSSSVTVSSPTISSAWAEDSTTASSADSPRNRGQIAGGTLGGLVLLVVIGLVGVWFIKRRRQASRGKAPSAMFANYSPYTEKRTYLTHQI